MILAISFETSKVLFFISLALLSSYFIKNYQQYSSIFLLLLIIITLRLFLISLVMPTTFMAKITDVKANYVIGKVKSSKVLIYSEEKLNYDDIISYTGDYTEIYNPKSKYSFQFDKYMLRNNIKYSIKALNVKVIKEKSTVRSKLYKRIARHPDKELLNKLFLRINSNEIKYDIIYLISSAGVFIKSLVYFIKSVLSKYTYSKNVFKIEVVLYIFFMLTFKQYLFYLNILLYVILKKLKYNKYDATFLSSTLVLLISPYYLFNLSFIINFSFRLISCIALDKKSSFWQALIVMIPIQLNYFYKANIISIIFYRYYKILGLITYLLASFDLIFYSQFLSKFLKLINHDLNYFTFTGQMPKLIFLLWIYFSLLLMSKNKLRYKLILVLILFINQNQLIFNPSLVYTQLYIGQGDSAIIRYPYKTDVVIIDTGQPKNKDKLSAYLDYYGIKKISSLIISHDDLDHSGNKDFLIENYNVFDLVEKPKPLSFYNLKINLINYDFDDDNDASIITYFKVNGWTYLSLGDVSKKVEKLFVKNHPHVLPNIIKLGHHGSDTSSSDELLSLSSIKLLINSSGYKNMYKHPNFKVRKRILKYQIPFIDTQDVGDINIIHLFGYNFIAY